MPVKKNNKKLSKKVVESTPWSDAQWAVVTGKLEPGRGRPRTVQPLFKFVAEKIPYAALKDLRKALVGQSKITLEGVYIAHDASGTPRYGGRGNIFSRLAAQERKYPDVLYFFSFYVIAEKVHEREIETAILRVAGAQMDLNIRKVRSGITVGNVGDYEPGTKFVQRQGVRGRKRLASIV